MNDFASTEIVRGGRAGSALNNMFTFIFFLFMNHFEGQQAPCVLMLHCACIVLNITFMHIKKSLENLGLNLLLSAALKIRFYYWFYFHPVLLFI